MAHFAVVTDGIVRNIHVVANEVITDGDGLEHEEWGQAFLSELHGLPSSSLIQCSYNSTMRGNYPSNGFIYDETLDVFMPPKPYDSWVLDEGTWVAPVPMPEDGGAYTWDEEAGDWVAANE